MAGDTQNEGNFQSEDDKRTQRIFAIVVYAVVALYTLLSAIQWILICNIGVLTDTFEDATFSYFAYIFAIVIFMIFSFLDQCRTLSPFNWILTTIIIECFVIGFIPIIMSASAKHFASVSVTVILIVCSTVIGTKIKCDLTDFAMFLFIVSLTYFSLVIAFITITVLVKSFAIAFIFSLCTIAYTGMNLAYNAQLIFGGRAKNFNAADTVLAVLLIYLHSFIMFAALLFIAIEIDFLVHGKSQPGRNLILLSLGDL